MQFSPHLPLPPELSAYTWRPIQPDDLDAIIKMLVDSSGVDKPETPPSSEHLRSLLGMLGEDIEQNTLCALAADGSMAAAGMVFIPPVDEERLALVDGNVHVAHRGRGLGGYLLGWMERRARQAFGDPADGLPQIMRTSCSGHQTDRIALYEQHGFKAMRYSYKMRRSLAQAVIPVPLPPGLSWAEWSPELDLEAMQAFNQAFSGHWGVPMMNPEIWRGYFTGVPQFRGDLSFLAMEGESVVGFCINWVEGAGTPVEEGWVEAIGVIPAWRGKGVASALMVQALSRFQAAGLRGAGLDVDAENPTGALRLYQKHGFEVVKESIHFVKQLI